MNQDPLPKVMFTIIHTNGLGGAWLWYRDPNELALMERLLYARTMERLRLAAGGEMD